MTLRALRAALIIAFVLCIVRTYALAAESQDIARQYRQKVVLLHSYYRGEHLVYDSDGALVKGGDPGTWTLDGHLLIKDVKTASNRIEIRGLRVFAAFDRLQQRWHALPAGPVRVDIKLQPGHADSDAILHALLKVFYPPTEDAGSHMPEYWKPELKSIQSQPSLLSADNKIILPEVLYDPMPVYSNARYGKRMQANMEFVALVDKTGLVQDVLALGPATGSGVNQGAVKTIRKWKYKPGTVNSQPTQMLADIHLTIIIRRIPSP